MTLSEIKDLKTTFDVEKVTTEQLRALQTMSVISEKYNRHLLNGTEKERRIDALDKAAWAYYEFWSVVKDELNQRNAKTQRKEMYDRY